MSEAKHNPTDAEPVPSIFDNGLTDAERDTLDDLMIDLGRITVLIDGLGRHRSYSLAITKIDEARHWLRDRKHRTEMPRHARSTNPTG